MGQNQTAKGMLRFEKDKGSAALPGGLIRVKVSGVLKAEGVMVGNFIKDGRYTVSGEQHYDPKSREWKKATWSVDVANELANAAGVTVAQAKGKMLVDSKMLADAPATGVHKDSDRRNLDIRKLTLRIRRSMPVRTLGPYLASGHRPVLARRSAKGRFLLTIFAELSPSLSLTSHPTQCICLRVVNCAEVWAPGCLRCFWVDRLLLSVKSHRIDRPPLSNKALARHRLCARIVGGLSVDRAPGRRPRSVREQCLSQWSGDSRGIATISRLRSSRRNTVCPLVWRKCTAGTQP